MMSRWPRTECMSALVRGWSLVTGHNLFILRNQSIDMFVLYQNLSIMFI